jgi:hypothetical protein
MPEIACVAWGSLVWDPQDLPLSTQWFFDGPGVRVEFLRQSSDERITLVLDDAEGMFSVPSLWALIRASDVEHARELLRRREGRCLPEHIGSWTQGEKLPSNPVNLSNWAQTHRVDAVVWTALPPRFRGQNGMRLTPEEVVRHLGSLIGDRRARAERYVRLTPQQIRTTCRRQIETFLQRTPDSPPAPSSSGSG